MNIYPHDLHRLQHYGLRGHAKHARELRQRRWAPRAGALIIMGFFLMGASRCAHAYEPSNAADVKGKFTLMVAGSVKQPIGYGYGIRDDLLSRLQLTMIPGFSSYHLCRAAGMELQARFNTDGYTLDFVCLLEGKL